MAVTQVPVLLIGDLADHNIPARHSGRITRFASREDALWEVTGADHGGAAGSDSEEFERRVLSWFASYKTAKPALR